MPKKAHILFFVTAFFMILAVETGNQAVAAPRYAAIVVDAHTGRVLHAENENRLLKPASLTKMMTLYIVFDQLKAGKISLDQRIYVSKHASGMPASKLGLKVGQTIKVRAALYAAAVKSSNDAAVVLSEAIAGTEWGFSKLMNIQAKRLGLKRTAFRNATGLTAKGHYSTVKDMSLLARRLWRDFPEYYSVFSTESIVWKRKKYRSTNALLRTYKGADGIKTGYTRASGYNLAASAKRGKQRLLVIVFGGKSSRSRNKQVKNLLDKGFKKLDWQLSHLKRASATSAILNDPKIKIISLEKNLAEAKKETGNQKNVSAAVAKAIADIGLNASTLEAPLEIQTASIPDFSKKKEYFFGKSWGVQLGAFGSRNRALGRIQEAIALPVSDIESAYHTLDEVQVGEKIAYRARFTGMQENEARGACRELKQRRLDCVVIPPHGW